jgi:DHA1 family bicyclomycin/chloramphenicol resistance-like MFS transporter
MLMDILGGAEMDLFVPSFPELQQQFGLSPFWVEALLSINLTGFFLSLLFVGGLADRYGRKPTILVGLIVFIIGSSLCVWAEFYAFLLAGRFLQGIGVAAPAVLCFLIIADAYSLKQQQALMGIMNALSNVAVASAPVVGSYITIYFHWQGNFMALLCFGVVVLGMMLLFIPKGVPPVQKEPISLKGFLPIFQSKPLLHLIITLAFMFVPYWIIVGMSPILYMKDLGVSLAHFGYYQGALACTFAVGSVIAGLLIHRYDQQKMLFLSAMLIAASVLITALVTFLDVQSPLLLTLSFLPFNTGIILPSMMLYPLCVNFLPEAKGRVSAMLQALRLLLTAIGLELAGYFYGGSYRTIGLVILGLTAVAALTLFQTLRNPVLMQRLLAEPDAAS